MITDKNLFIPFNFQFNDHIYSNKENINKNILIGKSNQTMKYTTTPKIKNIFSKEEYNVKNKKNKTKLRSQSTIVNGIKNEYSIPSKIFNSNYWKNNINNNSIKSLKYNYIKTIKQNNNKKENVISAYTSKDNKRNNIHINTNTNIINQFKNINKDNSSTLSNKKMKNIYKYLYNSNSNNNNDSVNNSSLKNNQYKTFNKLYVDTYKKNKLKISHTQKIFFIPKKLYNNVNNEKYLNNTIIKEINFMLLKDKDKDNKTLNVKSNKNIKTKTYEYCESNPQQSKYNKKIFINYNNNPLTKSESNIINNKNCYYNNEIKNLKSLNKTDKLKKQYDYKYNLFFDYSSSPNIYNENMDRVDIDNKNRNNIMDKNMMKE